MTGRFIKLASTVMALTLVSVLAAASISCGDEGNASGKIGVAVTILPQAEFAESVGGDRISVTVMVPPGASPHTTELTPSQMTEVAKARMYAKVGSGVEFELAYMEKIKDVNENMLIVDCSKGIELIGSVDPDEPGYDPHIWLSAANAEIMVRNICEGLVQIDPVNKAYYERNRDAYIEKLDSLDEEIEAKLTDVQNRAFIVFHPSWGYFAKDYNLEQIPIEIGGKEPSAQDVSRIIEEAKSRDIRVIFASPQFNPQMAEVIAREIGGRVVSIDQLARDYISNLRRVSEEMVEAME